MKPKLEDIPDFYQGYFKLTTEAPLKEQIQETTEQLVQLIGGLSEDQLNFRYEDGKWSIKEMLVHIIDTERVFAYRALCFSRGDQTPLPGFEQNDYVANSEASDRNIVSIMEEYTAVRKSSLELFKNLTNKQLANKGQASGASFSAASMGYLLVGHQSHHVSIIRERYLK